MSLAELLDQAREAFAVRGAEGQRRLDGVLAEILALRDPTCVGAFAEMFDDESSAAAAMCALIGAMERFPPADYARELLAASPGLCERAPGWSIVIFSRAMNVEAARLEMIRLLPFASVEERRAVRLTMGRINARDVRLVSRTTPVIMAAM